MDSYRRSARNALRAFSLERLSERRNDRDWLAGLLADARVVPVAEGDFPASVTDGTPLFIPAAELRAAFDVGVDDLVFLGMDGERAWFAWDAGDRPLGELGAETGRDTRWDLRRAGALLDAGTAGLLAYARALCHWHRNARFCGRCGGPTERRDGGHQRVCRDPACALLQFPRLDPAVIVCITRGERVLLGRQPQWPERRYSVIAGFVEPAESLEDAVRREAYEETGLTLNRVDYHSSQPWPFPASLMLGFTAESDSGHAVAGDELESVLWLDRDELAEAVERGELKMSPPLSLPAPGALVRCRRWPPGGPCPGKRGLPCGLMWTRAGSKGCGGCRRPTATSVHPARRRSWW